MPDSIRAHLQANYTEPMPRWLAEFRQGNAFDREGFFGSRIVFYPGSGDDGQPVRLFAGAHAAHVFVYADYGFGREQIIEQLHSIRRGFKGYELLAIIDLVEHDLVPHGWRPTLPEWKLLPAMKAMVTALPYGMVAILQRQAGFQPDHGPERLAILFLGADGIASYDALFCQPGRQLQPFALVIQDHGFGGNYTEFGPSGLLHETAVAAGVFPSLILSELRSGPPDWWPGYAPIEALGFDIGGVHRTERYLFLPVSHPTQDLDVQAII